MSGPDWHAINRAHWDEKVALHLGHGILNAIEEAELGPVRDRRILHLQCHFGRDTLILAQRGATVVGLDFSNPAIDAARTPAVELGLADRAHFVAADLYDARDALPRPAGFDMVFVTWGAITWLPDIVRWAEIVAFFLRPGGTLYLAEAHPAAMVFDDAAAQPDGRPGFYAPYFSRDAVVMQEPHDYVDETTQVANPTTHTWIHPLGEIVTALIDAGLRLNWLHEHDAVTWHMFEQLVEDSSGLWRWPTKPWLPLAFSLKATRE
jgi:SAM-dependent methyltransferase